MDGTKVMANRKPETDRVTYAFDRMLGGMVFHAEVSKLIF